MNHAQSKTFTSAMRCYRQGRIAEAETLANLYPGVRELFDVAIRQGAWALSRRQLDLLSRARQYWKQGRFAEAAELVAGDPALATWLRASATPTEAEQVGARARAAKDERAHAARLDRIARNSEQSRIAQAAERARALTRRMVLGKYKKVRGRDRLVDVMVRRPARSIASLIGGVS